MEKHTIVIPLALKAAFFHSVSGNKITFISAGAGWGKTTAAKRLLSRMPHRMICAQNAASVSILRKDKLFLLDDLQNVSPRMEPRLQNILRQSSKSQHFVILSRGLPPDWLLPYRQSGELEQFGAEDLALDLACLARLAKERGLDLPAADLKYVRGETGGHPVLTRLMLEVLSEQERLCRQTAETAGRMFAAYLDRAVFSCWDGRVRELMLRLPLAGTFDVRLAEQLANDSEAEALLWAVQRSCGCFECDGDVWRIRDKVLADYLQAKAKAELPAHERNGAHLAIARWYEEKGDYERALRHCREAGNRSSIIRILTERMRGTYDPVSHYALRDYYHGLAQEELMASPCLMCGMSLLYSLECNREGSDLWYTSLREYANKHRDDRLARGLCAILELILPQRTAVEVLKALPLIARQAADGTIVFPPLSASSGLPYMLRGCRDCSEWGILGASPCTSYDIESESLFGRGGVALRELLWYEVCFERNEDVSGFALRFAPLQKKIQTVGTPDTEFVLVALAARILAASGKTVRASALLEEFRERVLEQKNHCSLIANIDAMRCRISLLGEDAYADKWFTQSAPDDGECNFTTCYCFLSKVRCYIKRRDYNSALFLLGYMADFFQLYSRPLDSIETYILIAICLFRTGSRDWQDHLTDALKTGERYGYIAVFAAEGTALLPLLEQYVPVDIDPDYWRRLNRASIVQSGFYPDYLVPLDNPLQTLTDTEYHVLQLVCQNLSNSEIGQRLNIKLPTVKTHIHGIFAKLGVTTRAEVRHKAARLQLFMG